MRSPRPPIDFASLLSAQLKQAAAALVDGADDAAVHKARLALNKARALVRIGASGAPGLADLFQTAARSAMHCLALTRDLAAQERAALRAAAAERGKTARALTRIAGALRTARAANPAPDFAAIRQRLRDLLALAQVWPELSEPQLRHGLRKLAAKTRRARKRGLGSRSSKRRHRWRAREKDRLTAIALFGKAWPERRRKHPRLTKTLGKERDVALLIERLGQAPSPFEMRPKALKRALSALRDRRTRLAARADALGQIARKREG